MKSKNDASKRVQSTFKHASGSQSTTCKVCGMTYFPHIPKDKELHVKYHKKFVSGVSWPPSLHDKEGVLMTKSVRPTEKRRMLSSSSSSSSSSSLSLSSSSPIVISFVSVSKSSNSQLRKVEDLLTLVNSELSAPRDSQEWKKNHTTSEDVSIEGRAFVAIYQNKAIAIVTTDPIYSRATQCKWMVHKNQSIVPNQVNNSIKIGISRIWTAPNYRYMGIAKYLLQCVMEHSIYGVTLSKNEIGFSQPSFAGGLLAKSFNGVLHKSGEILIPVYMEK
ncbi:N-acetyltransferase Eco1p [[Candida] railenensis]|uniref:N-acetyltransferase ECO1 n=1 Tax=[Candida] railenensis TaxID=45579 RepID=A0A9P0QT35_9ASCO|nr:N-acetyltransferase Eco1p [[Candida] railenensis]